MNIIPVVDIRHGVVVQAFAGRRAEYRPVKSCLTQSVHPVEVVRAILRATGSRQIYVADLDGILEGRPDPDVMQQIVDCGAEVLLDAGVSERADVLRLRGAVGACTIVVASETWSDVSDLLAGRIMEEMTFSLDLRSGLLQLADRHYDGITPAMLVDALVDAGLQQLIILDIAAVGTGSGVTTLEFCRFLKGRYPALSVITGGGVHSEQCLQDARIAGVDGLLIASALHDGRYLEWCAGERRSE